VPLSSSGSQLHSRAGTLVWLGLQRPKQWIQFCMECREGFWGGARRLEDLLIPPGLGRDRWQPVNQEAGSWSPAPALTEFLSRASCCFGLNYGSTYVMVKSIYTSSRLHTGSVKALRCLSSDGRWLLSALMAQRSPDSASHLPASWWLWKHLMSAHYPSVFVPSTVHLPPGTMSSAPIVFHTPSLSPGIVTVHGPVCPLSPLCMSQGGPGLPLAGTEKTWRPR
jgi:hypothetical protein